MKDGVGRAHAFTTRYRPMAMASTSIDNNAIRHLAWIENANPSCYVCILIVGAKFLVNWKTFRTKWNSIARATQAMLSVRHTHYTYNAFEWMGEHQTAIIIGRVNILRRNHSDGKSNETKTCLILLLWHRPRSPHIRKHARGRSTELEVSFADERKKVMPGAQRLWGQKIIYFYSPCNNNNIERKIRGSAAVAAAAKRRTHTHCVRGLVVHWVIIIINLQQRFCLFLNWVVLHCASNDNNLFSV